MRLTLITIALVIASVALPSRLLAQQAPLPDGEAKPAVEAMCVQCHQIGRVTGMGMSRTEWKNTVEDMVRMGAQIPEEWVEPIADYLALNFPEKSHKDASVNAPTIEIVPEASVNLGGAVGSMTPDKTAISDTKAQLQSVVVGDDHVVWYADSRGFIGRYDPTSKEAKQWEWPTGAQPPPVGIALLGGYVWSTECARGTCNLVRLDPAASTFTKTPLPKEIAGIQRVLRLSDTQLAVIASGSRSVALISF